ncbi:MAG: GspE/PulE family protein [bacterium]|nr:GspE/PulE family protein [bacterium]
MAQPLKQKPVPVEDKQKELAKALENKLSDIQLQKTEDEAKTMADKFGLPYINLVGYPVDVEALGLLTEAEARAGQLAVVARDGNNLTIALVNPENKTAKDILAKLAQRGFKYSLAISSSADMAKILNRYSETKATEKVQLGVIGISENELSTIQQSVESLSDLKERLRSVPVGKILEIILGGALKIGASDIHFENEEKSLRLRYRVDGVLADIADVPKAGYEKIITRVKLMSGLKINVHNKPQDGRFTIKHQSLDMEVRAAVTPSEFGENIVLRILDPRTIKQNLEDLGMEENTLKTVKELLAKTTGAIMTTGPTGSGKTTTLYAFIQHINNPGIKVITIEDPIEYHIKGITQTQADEHAGYTFASGLKTIIRQDPDVILVGEIRDGETAEIAMQAALTGHLVFSTLHTNNAAGAIPRLIDLGVKPVTIAPAINATMAQRLARKLCEKCKTKQKIKEEDLKKIADEMAGINFKDYGLNTPDASTELYYPSQCKECNSTGYKGRTGIYELFQIDTEMEKLIQTSPAISDIETLAIKKGMVTLLQNGYIKVLKGITSVEEILRVMN